MGRINPITKPVVPVPDYGVGPVEPVQLGETYAVEWKDSRQSAEDLQRGTIIHSYIISGRPDQVAKDQAIGGTRMGYPHPWEKDAYVSNVRFEHWVHGPDPDTATDTPGTDRDARGWTKMTVTYRHMPCPGLWEEEHTVGLISRLEWFDRLDPPRELKGTREGTPILVPVPVYKRHFPKVFLKPLQFKRILDQVGKRSGVPEDGWHFRDRGFWLFEGLQDKLLYGNPQEGTSAHELTLIFRGDPERNHDWWWPKLRDKQLRPIMPASRKMVDIMKVFMSRRIYDYSTVDWDNMVPLRGTPERS